MYKVYSNNILIHDSVSPEMLMHLSSPKVTIQENGAGSFEATVPTKNPGYSEIKRMTSTILIKKEHQLIWTGRVLTDNEDFWKNRKITCEGALSFLNDSIQPLAYYDNYDLASFFTKLIEIHNSKVPLDRQFRIGTISVTDSDDDYKYKTEYKTTLETIQSVFLDRLDGHLRVRYDDQNDSPIIDYLKDYPQTAVQEINFGSNLLDFTKNWDLSNLATVILPRGKQLEEDNDRGDRDYLTIASVNNGNIFYENAVAVATYGRIEKIVDFSDCEDATLLYKLATRYAEEQQFDDMQLTVSAVDLHMIDENILPFELLDQVKCISAPHGLNSLFPITKIEIPLDKPDGIVYTMGNVVTQSLSAQSAQASRDFESRIANSTSLGNLLGDAKRYSTRLINQKTTGYVNIITENETSQALIISDKPDLESSTKLWRWNMNGLGYVNLDDEDNPEHNYRLAITNNGVIVADFIRTGVLEDGYGLNHWNLSTGEFSLAYNTEFMRQNGEVLTIVDVNDLAQQGYTTASIANNKQSGSDNLLNGTNNNLNIANDGESDWEVGTWDGKHSMKVIKMSVVSIKDAPNTAIKKGFCYSWNGPLVKNYAYMTQRNIPLAADTVYVLSCYAKGTPYAELVMSIGAEITGVVGTVHEGMYAKSKTSVISEWKRYSLTFRTGRNNISVPNNPDHLAGLHNGKCELSIGMYLDREKGDPDNPNRLYVCGMKIERGNTPTDWTESEFDSYDVTVSTATEYTDVTSDALQTYTRRYTDTISASDREFTKAQRQALDESFNQYKVLERLTNNWTQKGIWLENNKLYMSGDYIRTGTLDAGIIKTGILMDYSGKNKWNMVTGTLETKNMWAENIVATGKFEAGTDLKMVLSGGSIDGYIKNNQWVGSISPNSTHYRIDTKQTTYGLSFRAAGSIDIRSPYIAVRNRNDDGVARVAYTGTVKFDSVSRITDRGNGAIGWTTQSHTIEIINGLIVAIA